MKTKCIKYGMWLLAILLITHVAKAQTALPAKTAYGSEKNDNYDVNRDEQGRHVERIQANVDGKVIKAEFVDDKITELYVDGEKIQAVDWGKYNGDIATIREQIKKNREQAARNREQAQLNKIQAQKNQEQAVRNKEQAARNNEQAVRNKEQAARNREQETLNRLQEKKNGEQAERNGVQAKLNQEQDEKNAVQAVRNREQDSLNKIQAKKNQEQAEENERLMKELTTDLVTDKIIPDENSLRDFTINGYEMTVNGVRQPDDIFKKYKLKYSQFSKNSFNYSRDGTY